MACCSGDISLISSIAPITLFLPLTMGTHTTDCVENPRKIINAGAETAIPPHIFDHQRLTMFTDPSRDTLAGFEYHCAHLFRIDTHDDSS